jgi:membrane protein
MELFRWLWNKIKAFFFICKDAYHILMDNDPLRLASSAAFYAIFALPPSVLLLLTLFGIVLNEEIIGGEFFRTLEETFGEEVAMNVFWILRNLSDMGDRWWIFVGSMIIFAISATTLFIVVKNSINQLWNLMPLPERAFMSMLKRRAIALGIIFLGGVLSLLSILTDTIINFLAPLLPEIIPHLRWYFIEISNFGLTITILTIWFAFLFKYMPDAKIKWKIVWKGAIMTGVLFTLGKIIMHEAISYMNLGTIYGTTSSIIIMLLFIYYSAQIIFFGAAFTRSYANFRKIHIRPNSYAMKFKIIEERVDSADHLEKKE